MIASHGVRSRFTRGVAQLAAARIANPDREARYLWTDYVGELPVGAAPDSAPGDLERFDRAIQRRAAGEPLAYVLGGAAFRYVNLAVDRRVLIPRPETEGLVELVLAWCGDREGLRGLEIGVGSGCIALSLAHEGRFATLVGTDLSREALAVARHNGLSRRAPVTWVLCDAADAINPATRFDVIVSNPPYLTDAEYDALDPSVREYEPRVALAAGTDGLDVIRAVCRAARARLAPRGLVAVEIDARRPHDAASIATAAGLHDVRVEPDLTGRSRYLLAHQPAVAP